MLTFPLVRLAAAVADRLADYNAGNGFSGGDTWYDNLRVLRERCGIWIISLVLMRGQDTTSTSFVLCCGAAHVSQNCYIFRPSRCFQMFWGLYQVNLF